MSVDSAKSRSQRRERALEATRRRLRRLEIETHRVKAELARLEAENEDDLADVLDRELCVDATGFVPRRSVALQGGSPRSEAGQPGAARSGSAAAEKAPQVRLPQIAADPHGARSFAASRRRKRRGNRPAWLSSFGLHAATLLLCVPWTYAVLSNDELPLLSSGFTPTDVAMEDATEAPIQLVSFEELAWEDVPVEQAPLDFDLAESLTPDLSPVADEAAGPTDAVGQLEALPSDVGTLMVGAGEGTGTGRSRGDRPLAGGRRGSIRFFDTEVRADRIVFVVDNSSSMKDGRLEAAIAQLLVSVEAMTRRQSFYVIFVSDQPYPMFYPDAAPALVPATEPNKRRLGEWLGRVLLADGKNRELIKAMDLAAALRPEAVFLLWDGDLRYSDRVRQDVMTHLTRPNGWRFTVHTFGMGVTSLDAQQHLSAIATAHGGTYRPVPLPKPRGRGGPSR